MSPNPITDAIGLIIILIMAGGLIGLSLFGCLLGALSDLSTKPRLKDSQAPRPSQSGGIDSKLHMRR